ncbi:hypothetical protein PFISCL1PPCAC_18392 [Pristionchus fissidentatus]|uniref:Phospholipid scramblase n=1 Tax=Pristionchus fissidentatus TaxID=1538716 RepID=A0AAV5W5T0_9BILA|nr:hypothetical protein PFISCL1PPCAC_18392 [Pristionchus fissidentatus]
MTLQQARPVQHVQPGAAATSSEDGIEEKKQPDTVVAVAEPQLQELQQSESPGEMIRLAAGEEWMGMPTVPLGMTIPPGLEYLLPCSGAHVRQRTDMVEMFTNIDTPNKYAIYNDQGQFMYFAQEMQGFGGFMEAQFLGDNRGFFFRVTDPFGRHAFSVSRSSKVWTDCEMVVEAPPGIPAGFVYYASSLCSRGSLTISDAAKRPVLSIPFPSECDCGGERGYVVMTGAGVIGTIIREYPGFMKQVFTNCDNFSVNFPGDLDVRMKCTLLACAIMIDFIDFEDKRQGSNSRNRGGYGYGYGGYYSDE